MGQVRAKQIRQIVAAGSSGNWHRLAGMGRTDSRAWEAGAGEVEAGWGVDRDRVEGHSAARGSIDRGSTGRGSERC